MGGADERQTPVTREGLIAAVNGLTMTSIAAQNAMIDALIEVHHRTIKGAVVECGVWRGGNIILARKLLPDRRCWLYDTFDGMTVPGENDISRRGKIATEGYANREARGEKWCGASLEEVTGHLRAAGVNDPARLRFVVGDVTETLLDPGNLPKRIALLRLDTDWEASTAMELAVLYPRLAVGGILIIDDYGHWMGCRRAVDAYFADQSVRLTRIDYTAVMMRKAS